LNSFIINLTLLISLLITPHTMADQQASGEHKFISFDSDSNGNLIIHANPIFPQKHSRDNAGHIAARLRKSNAIPGRDERLKATAKLLFDLSKKYEFSTKLNRGNHYIAFPYTDQKTRSIHRISKDLPRSDYDRQIKKHLQALIAADNLVMSHSD